MVTDELEKIEHEIVPIKQQENNQSGVMALVEKQQNTLLSSKEFEEISKKFGEEKIKSELAEEASKIKAKNQETAERDFETETRELRLKHLKEQLKREHKYNMDTLDRDAKHSQMLDRRRKLVEKYGYLYDCSSENTMVVKDGKNQGYNVPKDFSYSNIVNKFRKFGRDISKLDRPFLQTLKWIVILGLITLGYLILKKYGILN